MKANPTVSIAIATYNRAHLLKRAIQSILNQTYQDFEIIVVDDGSTENTEEVVKSFTDKRIRFIKHKENKGLSATRNTGIKAARGKYVAFQDDDDEWLPEKLEKQMNVFKNAQRKVGVVYTGFWRIEGDKKIYIPSREIQQKDGDIHKEILKGNFITAQAAVVKKECFQISGMFDEQIASRQDWELWIKISKDWYFKFIDEPLTIVYRIPDSISLRQKVAITGWKPILEKHLTEFKKDRKLLAKHYLRIGASFNLLDSREFYEGRKYIFKAIRTWPLINISYLIIALISLLGLAPYTKVVKLYRRIRIIR